MPTPPSRAQIALIAALFFALFFKAHTRADGDVSQRIEKGNAAFESGDFETATREYEAAVALGTPSPELFLFLGNAHYRNAAPGKAALWWRRAQITDPLLAEAFQNHRFIEKKSGLLRFDSDTLNWATALLPLPAWLIIGVSGAWVLLLGILAVSLHPPRKAWRTLAKLIGWMGFLVALVGFTGYFLKSYRDIPNVTDLAVVTQKIAAKTDATDDGGTVIELPPGSEVNILGERGPWTYIGIPGDLRGWIRTGSVEKLWPFDPAYLR